MGAIRTARDRARAELVREIKDEARRQLAAEGAERLSLRAVARELGMVSSALYRYFPSRDELLTALIVDAYDALGSAAEAVAPDPDPVRWWCDVCLAVRAWAVEHPHEYALIYGSPIAGYRAPVDTVAPAIRVPTVLIGVLQRSWSDGTLATPADGPEISAELAGQVERIVEAIPTDVPGPVLVRLVVAWTQLFGMVSFELFGQFVGSVDPATHFFADATERMATFVGLRPLTS